MATRLAIDPVTFVSVSVRTASSFTVVSTQRGECTVCKSPLVQDAVHRCAGLGAMSMADPQHQMVDARV